MGEIDVARAAAAATATAVALGLALAPTAALADATVPDVTSGAAATARPTTPDDGPARSIDVGAWLGLDVPGDDIELGNAWADEQVPNSNIMAGLRVGVTVLPDLAPGSSLDPSLGVEAEAGVTLSSTGESVTAGRRAYFAPVLTTRAQLIARLGLGGRLTPHLVVGGGADSVVSSSPFLGDDSDASFHWGPGLSWDVGAHWQVRLDLRHGITAGRDAARVNTFELHAGLEHRFGLGGADAEAAAVRVPVRPADADGDGIADSADECPGEPETTNGYRDGDGCPDVADGDGDGLADADDACPSEAENLNQIDDADGCPEVDGDGDGLIGSLDGCPDAAEDRDGTQDDDGCPDLDDDGDGRADAVDGCPREPETVNGFEDDDGCPDEVPLKVRKFTGVISGITFESGRARIRKPSHKALGRAIAILDEFPSLRIRIEGHTDSRGAAPSNLTLSQRRADAVKWFLVDAGIGPDRIESVGIGEDRPLGSNRTGRGRARNRRIEFHLITEPAPAPTAAPEAAPATTPDASPAPAPAPP